MTNGYAGRSVLVFGATGFIGRWTTQALVAAGADVRVAVRRKAYAYGLYRYRRPTIKGLRYVDLAVPGAAAQLVAETAPDVVFNLAGYGVRPTERDEATARRINVDVVTELGEALAARTFSNSRPALVHVGSAAEYGSVGGDLDEAGPASPTSLYGRTKLDGTLALTRLARERGLRVVVARLFTVYGLGEPEGRLLPTLLAASRDGPPVRLTAGTQRRDFTYVEDVAEGLVRLGDSEAAPGLVVNLATGTLRSVRDFVLDAADVLGMADASLEFGAIANTRDEMEHEPVTTERLDRLLGWRPTTTVRDGVRRTRELLPRAERP